MQINVKSQEGNAFAIMGAVQRLLKDAGRGDEVAGVMARMTSGDYRHLCEVAEEVTNGTFTFIGFDDEDD